MDLRKLNDFVAGQNGDLTYEDVLALTQSKQFAEAGKKGEDWLKSQGSSDFEDAPFCIDTIKPSKTRVVLSDEAFKIYKDMHKKALSQSDTPQKDGDNYEASFYFAGRKEGDTIILDEAYWDKSGFIPEKPYDPDDCYGELSAMNFDSNVTKTSGVFDSKLEAACKIPVSASNVRVVVNGHTHPQTREYGQINNYPSRTDIVLAVEEAAKYHVQGNRTCTFLNAIVTADGDLNILGVDEKGEFVIFDNVKNKKSEKVPSYTEGKYPLSKAGEFSPN